MYVSFGGFILVPFWSIYKSIYTIRDYKNSGNVNIPEVFYCHIKAHFIFMHYPVYFTHFDNYPDEL